MRLSEQLAAVMAELRQATEANRQRQELNSQVGPEKRTGRHVLAWDVGLADTAQMLRDRGSTSLQARQA